jgi:hypothetical protein
MHDVRIAIEASVLKRSRYPEKLVTSYKSLSVID